MISSARPPKSMVRAADFLVNTLILLFVALLLLYSSYSIWHIYSLSHGSFLSDELAMYKPTGVSPTLADLAHENQDVCSWITLDDTNIDYPVVQGKDDWEYLNKDVMGEFSLAGSIFLASTNSRDFSDPYSVLYGHHIKGGAMFSDVLEFRKSSYFDTHRTGILWLVGEMAYKLEIFACMDVNAADEVVFQDPHRVTPENLVSLVNDIMKRSIQTRTIPLSSSDHIIALSTCEDAESFERVVLFCKLLPMSDEEIKAAKQKNLEKREIAPLQQGRNPLSILFEHPWQPGGIGALLLLLIILLAWRHFRH